ncbi:M1 family metallopeptidase [Candidatus Micrarchaeota archaeon]|nr:M1 family metallopeptidase [Candidatus Micrarchaeota archaeon]
MTKNDHYTIAADAIPSHYELYFEPNLKTFEFRGIAIITFQIKKETNSILLNAKDLKIHSAKIISSGSEQECSFKLIDNNEVIFSFLNPVNGEIKLTIEYGGVHNDKLYGFYRSRYSKDGKEGYILSTQFEAPNARAAFPCLDEPSFKAIFDVTIATDVDLEAISNMPIKETRIDGGKKVYVFESSPKMSTYLLYLGVGKFERVSGDAGNVKMNVYSVPGKSQYQQMPLEYGKKLFLDLQTYFQIDYPLPKMDLIAVPDFAAGAMENWGAITFRETALLGNESETSVGGKQRIAEVIAHEIAHMWFGDLVTMVWWDDMWLNESFATYMEYKSVDRVFPQWKAMQKYYLDSVGSAFVADGLKNTHPISVQVNTAGEISELFDAIGYNKGGSVLLMLEDFVGPQIFRNGLINYLKTHAYSNATKKDLWHAIELESRSVGKDYPVVEIMEDWITREGYPIVSVKKITNGVFEIEQERFTISGNVKGGIWKIPITYLCEKGERKLILREKKTRITNAGSWIKLNYKQAGFYRVRYEIENLTILGEFIRNKKLESLDAWGIENDLFALLRSGEIHLPIYLDFVKNYCVDLQYPANVNLSGHLSWLTSILFNQPLSSIVKAVNVGYHVKLLDSLGFDVKPNESSIDTKLRSMALSELGLCGYGRVVDWSKKHFQELLTGKSSINPNLKRPIYFTTAFNSPDLEKFDQFLKVYGGSGSPEDKIIALVALGNLGDSNLLESALNLALSKEVRLQDSVILLGSVASNPSGRLLYMNWALTNWKRFMELYDPSSHMLKNCVSGFGMLADEVSYVQLKTFFSDKSNLRDDIKLEVLQTFERIEANIKLIKKNVL